MTRLSSAHELTGTVTRSFSIKTSNTHGNSGSRRSGCRWAALSAAASCLKPGLTETWEVSIPTAEPPWENASVYYLLTKQYGILYYVDFPGFVFSWHLWAFLPICQTTADENQGFRSVLVYTWSPHWVTTSPFTPCVSSGLSTPPSAWLPGSPWLPTFGVFSSLSHPPMPNWSDWHTCLIKSFPCSSILLCVFYHNLKTSSEMLQGLANLV